MAQLAILWAGQGSQYTGMGLDFVEAFPRLQVIEQEASSLLGYSVKELLMSSDGRLNDTLYTQPATVLTSVFIWEALQSAIPFSFHSFAGFSLGEYSALYGSEVLSLKTLLKLIQERSLAMKAAAETNRGQMAAILGLDVVTLEALCREVSTTSTPVYLANLNCPGQTVISGHPSAVEKAIELAKAKGARRAIMLNVSGAFHSPLMLPAAKQFEKVLISAPLAAPRQPIYMNVTAQPAEVSALKRLMVDQITSPVRFEDTIRAMIKDGTTHFLEIGPGNVLSGFVKKIVPEVPIQTIAKVSDLDIVKGWLKQHGFAH